MARTLDELISENAALTGDKAKLKTGATLPADLVGAANTIADLTARIVALEGDKTKLATGATMPTDLVSAGNSIASITKERDDAKAEVTKLTGEKKTVEQAVAAKLTELGITDKGAKIAKPGKADEKLSLTQQCLKANGHKTDEKLSIGANLVGSVVAAASEEVTD